MLTTSRSRIAIIGSGGFSDKNGTEPQSISNPAVETA
jgi:hypothetical protein